MQKNLIDLEVGQGLRANVETVLSKSPSKIKRNRPGIRVGFFVYLSVNCLNKSYMRLYSNNVFYSASAVTSGRIITVLTDPEARIDLRTS